MKHKSEKFTFGNLLKQMKAAERDKELFVYYSGNTRKVVNADEFLKQIGQYASALGALLSDAPENAWVGLHCRNSKDWFALFFAILCTGHPAMLLDENSSAAQLSNFIEQGGLCAVVTDSRTSFDQCPAIAKAELDKEISADTGSGSLPPPELWADEISFVTSGTTGSAKIYVFSAQSIYEQTCRLTEHGIILDIKYNVCRSDYVLQLLPLRHCFGLGTALAYFYHGYVLVFPRSIGVLDIIRTIRAERTWLAATVPAVWKGFLQVLKVQAGGIDPAAFRKVFGPYFTCTICAGTRLETSLIQNILETGISLFSGWGMTETGIAILGELTAGRSATGYVGEMLNWYRGKLNDDGELLIAGDVMHSARIEQGVQIPRTADWFATGDIFRSFNNDYYFVGRSRSVLIGSDGENVYPEEIEEELAEFLKDICSCCVFGEEERPVLLAADLTAGTEELASRIRDYNRHSRPGRRIAAYYLTDQMPLTEKGEAARFYAGSFVKNNHLERKTLMKGAAL